MTCEHCSGPIPKSRQRRSGVRYCSDRCSLLARTARRKQRYADGTDGLSLSASNRGALGELLACADLLARGFEVFRSVSATCSCDLIARSPDGAMWRIEVRTGWRVATGFRVNKKDSSRYDVCAVVLPDRTVIYDPPFPDAIEIGPPAGRLRP